jgi:hypothetical protein
MLISCSHDYVKVVMACENGLENNVSEASTWKSSLLHLLERVKRERRICLVSGVPMSLTEGKLCETLPVKPLTFPL